MLQRTALEATRSALTSINVLRIFRDTACNDTGSTRIRRESRAQQLPSLSVKGASAVFVNPWPQQRKQAGGAAIWVVHVEHAKDPRCRLI